MKVRPDPETAFWLEIFASAPRFDWNAGNLRKNEKHEVEPEDVESLFNDPDWCFVGRIVSPRSAEWRGLVLGRDHYGRALALIFTIRRDALRPISCRRMRDEEKTLYGEYGPGRAPGPGH